MGKVESWQIEVKRMAKFLRKNGGIFTTRAATLWSTVPETAKGRILKNVFCVKFRGVVEIVTFTAMKKNGEIILTCQYAIRGHEVVRDFETFEVNWSRN
jgi:hypothetical protein